MADFIAIDFETANDYRESACAVALVVFENRRISERYEWLIRPPRGFDHFEPFNTQIHGINSWDVADKPRFDAIWPEIFGLINNQLLAAHNASFDMEVLRQLLNTYNLHYPELDFVCTYNIARKTWGQLTSHALNTVASYLGHDFKHHQAADDARVCGQILVDACTHHDCLSVHDLARKIGMCVGNLGQGAFRPCSVSGLQPSMGKRWGNSLKIKELDKENIDPQGVFAGKKVVFTGTLLTTTRQEAAQRVVNEGGQAVTGVSRKTDYLVLGVQDYARLADGKNSQKVNRAKELIEQGCPLEIIDEKRFLKILSREKDDR